MSSWSTSSHGTNAPKEDHRRSKMEVNVDGKRKRIEDSRDVSPLRSEKIEKNDDYDFRDVTASTGNVRTTIPPPRAVVGEDYSADNGVTLRKAWVGRLRDKRDISSAMKMLSSILPGMSHLKRCSGNRVILAFEEDLGDDDRQCRLESLLTNCGLDRSIFDEEFEIVPVPAARQRTKAQAKIASRYWPINFHPDPLIERILNGCFFDNRELETIERCMKACIDAAETNQLHGDLHCNGSAVIYNKRDDKIVAIAVSRIDLHPLWHAAILAISHVAKLAGGVETIPTSVINLIDETGFAPLSSNSSSNRPYLCTDYWIFLLREPCPLCAMALVHSRVTDVFYGITNKYHGVLGSRALLHTTPSLNHRYRVWTGVCEQQCQRAFNFITSRQSYRPIGIPDI